MVPMKKEESCANSMEDSTHLVGDGLSLKMSSNKGKLQIDGNCCCIQLKTNYGQLRVTGDGSQVRVMRNLGSIEYVGNRGEVILGPNSDLRDVKYVGNGGSIRVRKRCKNHEVARATSDNVPSAKTEATSSKTTTKSVRKPIQDSGFVLTSVTSSRSDDLWGLISKMQTDAKAGAGININMYGVNGTRMDERKRERANEAS